MTKGAGVAKPGRPHPGTSSVPGAAPRVLADVPLVEGA